MNTEKRIRIAYLAFLECEVRGGWLDDQIRTPIQIGQGDETYWRVWQEPAEIHLVRPDGLKRILSFRNGAVVIVHNGMIEFNQEDFIEELAIDEDAKAGKPPRTKLDFS